MSIDIDIEKYTFKITIYYYLIYICKHHYGLNVSMYLKYY